MTHASQSTFTPIGQILAGRVLPALRRSQKIPLRVSCLGTISFAGATDADRPDHSISLGEAASPEDAIALGANRVARGDIRHDAHETLHFAPRLIVIQDCTLGLVLAGEIRVGIVLWQQPVVNDGEARRVVIEASRLRGMAFAASGRGDYSAARDLRFQAARLEARLVDPLWRETAADLLRLPRAA